MIKSSMTRPEFDKLKQDNPGYLPFVVVTGSMVPLIEVGEKIVVDTTVEPALMDIVVFWQNEKLVCHILWHKNKILSASNDEIWVTRSLKGLHSDLAITKSDVLGKVVSHKLSLYWKVRVAWTLFRHRQR